MSERFAILNAEAPSKKSRGERPQENSKGNIFKQKSKTATSSSRSVEELKQEPNRNQPNRNPPNRNPPNLNVRTQNLFARQQNGSVKDQAFNASQCSFPVLTETTVAVTESSGDSYKEKIQKTKEENQTKVTVPAGWIILTKKGLVQRQQPVIGEENHYYNPSISRLIMKNRQEHRKELNYILGDISPYWNMFIESEDNQQEYDETIYSEEEDDYVEEW